MQSNRFIEKYNDALAVYAEFEKTVKHACANQSPPQKGTEYHIQKADYEACVEAQIKYNTAYCGFLTALQQRRDEIQRDKSDKPDIGLFKGQTAKQFVESYRTQAIDLKEKNIFSKQKLHEIGFAYPDLYPYQESNSGAAAMLALLAKAAGGEITGLDSKPWSEVQLKSFVRLI